MKLPANISSEHTLQLEYLALSSPLKEEWKELKLLGWEFFIVSQRRGRCYYRAKIITIPLWALLSSRPNYWIYYLAHEMAHTPMNTDHNAAFMREFQRICPKNLWFYETEYKPRNAAAAGISFIPEGVIPENEIIRATATYDILLSL